MSRVDLDPITLEQLAHGSGMSACCDEAELRANHDTLSARVSEQFKPAPWPVVLGVILVASFACFFLGSFLGPIDFNPFSR